jgi:hypothetical protein
VPTDPPRCRNAAKFHDHESDMRLRGEGDTFWLFQCANCELTQVVSKDGVRDKSKFEALSARRQRETEIMRRLDARPKYF